MRSLIALALTTTPALAHSAPGAHLHDAPGVWLAVAALGVSTLVTFAAALRKPAKVRA